MLFAERGQVRRLDYASETWPGAPPEAIGWWKSRIPPRGEQKPRQAPSDVLLQLMGELANQADQQDFRYLLALLLVRRRVLRLEDTRQSAAGHETLILYCARNETTLEVAAEMPSEQRVHEIQEQLTRLLDADLHEVSNG